MTFASCLEHGAYATCSTSEKKFDRRQKMLLKSSTLKILETGLPFKLDQGIADFLTALTPDELGRLEESIKKVGCRDALVVWKEENILLDGYHRLALCQKHNKPFNHVLESYPSRAEALIMVMDNNKGRRGHSDSPFYDCEKVIIEFEEHFKRIAKERKREAGKVHGRGQKKVSQQDGKPFHVDEELAKLAGWSSEAIRMTRFIMKHGKPWTQEGLRKRRPDTSLRSAFEETKHRFRMHMMIIEAIQTQRKMAKAEGSDIDLNWERENAEIQAQKKEFEKDRTIIKDLVKQTAEATKVVVTFITKLGMYEEAIGSDELGTLFKVYDLESSIDKLSEKIQEFKKRKTSK